MLTTESDSSSPEDKNCGSKLSTCFVALNGAIAIIGGMLQWKETVPHWNVKM